MAIDGVVKDDILKVVVSWQLPDVVIAQTVHRWVRIDDVGDTIPFATMMGYVATKCAEMFAPLEDQMVEEVTIVEAKGYTVKWINGEWATEYLAGAVALDIQGNSEAGMLPHGVACLISYPSQLSRTIGKTYLPGMRRDNVVDSAPNQSLRDDLADYAAEAMSTWEPGGGYIFLPVFLSYKLSTPIGLTSAVISPYVAYQRRRGPGRGS